MGKPRRGYIPPMIVSGSDSIHVDPLPDGWARRVRDQPPVSDSCRQLAALPMRRELVFREGYNLDDPELENILDPDFNIQEAENIQTTFLNALNSVGPQTLAEAELLAQIKWEVEEDMAAVQSEERAEQRYMMGVRQEPHEAEQEKQEGRDRFAAFQKELSQLREGQRDNTTQASN